MTPEQEKAISAAKARLAGRASSSFTPAQQAVIDAATRRVASTPGMASGLAELSSMTTNPQMPDLGAADYAAQAASGVNTGIGRLLGAPVDLLTGALNLGSTGVNYVTGSEIPMIADPVGGSGTFGRVADQFNVDARPDDAVARYARSIGEEIGASAIPAGGVMSRAARPLSVAAGAAASSAGAGVGSQVARDIFPDSPVAELVGGLAGGMAPLAFSRSPKVSAPSVEDLRDQASDLYSAGRARPGADQSAVSNLRTAVQGELTANSRITPSGKVIADGNVKKFLDVLEDYQGHNMNPGEMQNLRTFLQDAAASTDAGERRMGKVLLERFDEWRGQYVPEFKAADTLYGRAKRAEDIDWRIYKADNRAKSTGTGGNVVNAARQNIRAILDNPKARRGYSKAEIEAMEAIVRGDAASNALRWMGRFSPDAGFLPGIGGFASVGAATQVGPLAMIPSAMGYISKGGAEALTNRRIGLLSQMIRNGGPSASGPISEARMGLIAAMLGQQAH